MTPFYRRLRFPKAATCQSRTRTSSGMTIRLRPTKADYTPPQGNSRGSFCVRLAAVADSVFDVNCDHAPVRRNRLDSTKPVSADCVLEPGRGGPRQLSGVRIAVAGACAAAGVREHGLEPDVGCARGVRYRRRRHD